MALESVLLALLGVVAVWLLVDAGRERHRFAVRVRRAAEKRRASRGHPLLRRREAGAPIARTGIRYAGTPQPWVSSRGEARKQA